MFEYQSVDWYNSTETPLKKRTVITELTLQCSISRIGYLKMRDQMAYTFSASLVSSPTRLLFLVFRRLAEPAKRLMIGIMMREVLDFEHNELRRLLRVSARRA